MMMRRVGFGGQGSAIVGVDLPFALEKKSVIGTLNRRRSIGTVSTSFGFFRLQLEPR